VDRGLLLPRGRGAAAAAAAAAPEMLSFRAVNKVLEPAFQVGGALRHTNPRLKRTLSFGQPFVHHWCLLSLFGTPLSPSNLQ
jgi:hypothetical protein